MDNYYPGRVARLVVCNAPTWFYSVRPTSFCTYLYLTLHALIVTYLLPRGSTPYGPPLPTVGHTYL